MGPDRALERIVLFAARGALVKSEFADESFDLVLAQHIIFGVSFFGVLHSVYVVILDRYDLPPPPTA